MFCIIAGIINVTIIDIRKLYLEGGILAIQVNALSKLHLLVQITEACYTLVTIIFPNFSAKIVKFKPIFICQKKRCS